MLIVVDTNVFVGACLGMGASSAVIAACLKEEHIPLMGTALFCEYEDVLSRSVLFRKSRLSIDERDELLNIFLATCRWTRIYFGWRPNLPDESDNHLVELAVAGGASHIVTQNIRDVGRMELLFPELSVVTPKTFLEEVRHGHRYDSSST
jgi:putative PIN family toxin of toxin-antitoxin system